MTKEQLLQLIEEEMEKARSYGMHQMAAGMLAIRDRVQAEWEEVKPLTDLCSSCMYRNVCYMRASGVEKCLGYIQEAANGQC